MTHCISPEDIMRLWSSNIDIAITDDIRITLYWHHRLQCMPLVFLHWLADRGVLLNAILKVSRIPLCVLCAFTTAHFQEWRTNSKCNHSIRERHKDNTGSGTSCNHIVSHKPRLIHQYVGKLTCARFWGSVLYVDHMSDVVYNHLITATSSMESLQSKQAYETVAKSYGFKIKIIPCSQFTRLWC